MNDPTLILIWILLAVVTPLFMFEKVDGNKKKIKPAFVLAEIVCIAMLIWSLAS